MMEWCCQMRSVESRSSTFGAIDLQGGVDPPQCSSQQSPHIGYLEAAKDLYRHIVSEKHEAEDKSTFLTLEAPVLTMAEIAGDEVLMKSLRSSACLLHLK